MHHCNEATCSLPIAYRLAALDDQTEETGEPVYVCEDGEHLADALGDLLARDGAMAVVVYDWME